MATAAAPLPRLTPVSWVNVPFAVPEVVPSSHSCVAPAVTPTTRSGAPSPLTSPSATEEAPEMEPICVLAAKPFQSPLASAPALRYSKTEPPATAMRSALPSPLTSATASAVTPVPGAHG